MKVREVLKLLADDGWQEIRRRGSHRQLRHDHKLGTVTVAGKIERHTAPKDTGEYSETSGIKDNIVTNKYLVVIEGDDATNYSAYSPDLPGVVATGKTRDDCEREMTKAISFHIEGLREAGEPVPEPSSTGAYVEIDPSAA